MRKKWTRILCMLLCIMLLSESSMTAVATENAAEAAEGTETEEGAEASERIIPEASTYLYPFEEAATALEALLSDHAAEALVYMGETVDLKEYPNPYSNTLQQLLSGDLVQILGVGQDTGYNIWFRVALTLGEDQVTGYIPRGNLAYSDEKLLEWEASYLRSVSFFRMRGLGDQSMAEIEQFPSSYREKLTALKTARPNWIFVPKNINLSWNSVINAQLGDKSLIHSSSPANWKNGTYGDGWAYASTQILKYYMDPRNGLTESAVFQFEQLDYNTTYHTAAALQSILNGTFMESARLENSMTYCEAFLAIGNYHGISPFMLAGRVIQEQGNGGTSPLISGTYQGYEGYYNYFNVGASGKTNQEIIKNGLEKAKEEGWETRYEALMGGAALLGNSYVKRGQNTLYFQKFNVVSYPYHGHQYMQNIKAPTTESYIVKKAYEEAGVLNKAFVFCIPVYNDMPSSASVKPGEEDKITLAVSEITDLPVKGIVTLQPLINGNAAEDVVFAYESSDTEVAQVDDTGKVTALRPGTVTITCRKAESMENTIAGSCTITVIKADIDPASIQVPVLEPVTYDPLRTLADVKLPEGFAWSNPATVPAVAQTGYPAVYQKDSEKYNSFTLEIPLEVKKAIPAGYKTPENLQGQAGGNLYEVGLPQGFHWEDGTQKLPETVGSVVFTARYHPDPANYEAVTGLEIPVQIICSSHKFGEWEVTEAACETDGSRKRSCTACGYQESSVLPAHGHAYAWMEVIEATEEQEGSRTYVCSRCQDSYSETIPKISHKHAYKDAVIREAACTENGVRKFSCSCGDSYEEPIPATGHNITGDICSVCGYKGDTGTDTDTDTNTNTGTGTDTNTGTGTGTGTGGSQTPPPAPATPSATTPATPPPAPTAPSTTTPATSSATAPATPPPASTAPAATTPSAQTPSASEASATPVTPPRENTGSASGQEETLIEALVNATQTEGREDETQEEEQKKAVHLQLNKNTRISKSVVTLVQERGVDLVVTLADGSFWIIDTATVGDMPEEVDMHVEFAENIIPKELVEAFAEGREYREFRLAHEGEFGFDTSLTVTVEQGFRGMTANLFYYNPQVGTLEYQTEGVVTEECHVTLPFTHASEYVLIFADTSMKDMYASAAEEEAADTLPAESEEAALAEEAGKPSALPMILGAAAAGILLVIAVIVCRRWKESRYFDEDVDDYKEKS